MLVSESIGSFGGFKRLSALVPFVLGISISLV